jgi:hypothetical protein
VNAIVTPVIGGTALPDAPGGRIRSVNPARTSDLVAEVALGPDKR